MFDFSFAELVVIMVAALIVIGPERLPKVARTMGHLWGRAQRYVNGVKADIERDMAVDEFRQLQQKVQAEAGEMEKSFQEAAKTADQQVQEINEEVAKLSSTDDKTQSSQSSQLPAPPVTDPSVTTPAKKSE
jgi:sec-independent protein translocase protein TatB